MKSAITARVIGACLIAIAACASAAENEAKASLAKPYVTVNGFTQPNARAEILLREQIARGVPDSQQLREGVRDLLINQALMEQQADKEGLGKEVLIQAQMDLARQSILAQAWQQKVLSELTVKDSDIKAEFDKQIARLGNKEYLLRHLLVAEESTAKLLLEKVQAGAKLADLSKEYSRDAGTLDKGGLTDWTAQGNLLPALAAAVKGLNKGQVVDHPVKTEAGWHVVQVEDVRPFKAPTLEDLKPQLTQIVTRRQLEARIKLLRDEAKIE